MFSERKKYLKISVKNRKADLQEKEKKQVFIKARSIAQKMEIYSHPLFLEQGKANPGKEHPERLSLLEDIVFSSEHIFSLGDEEDPELLARIEAMHSYREDLQFQDAGEAIDDEKETFVDSLAYKAACAGVATSIYAAEAHGFALVRPPGHHAHRELTHGYCLFNNMALAAKTLLENGERVLVLDLDVHHGCGTEELLADEEDACMISIYQKNIWPEANHFAYAQNCTHIPLSGRIRDAEYLHIFEKQVLPEIEEWNPSVIGVSLGLDTFSDEQFGWELTAHAIKRIRQLLKRKQLFAILEGGYTEQAVFDGVCAFLKEP